MGIKIVSLLSSGIDSPVAAHLLGKAGAEVVILNLDHRPFTDDKTIKIVDDLMKKLKEKHPNMEAYRSKFEDIQKAIAEGPEPMYRCIICRRMMYRAAEKLAKQIGANAIATGESLGQVASQTLSNLATEDIVVDMKILRPLLGLDKNEIIEIAKELGTYEISTKPASCCLLTPNGPKIKSHNKEVMNQEKKINISNLIEELEFYEL